MAISPAPGAEAAYDEVAAGHQWGPVWSDAWFRFSGVVPHHWAGRAVVAQIDCGAEAIVWDGDNPLQGIDCNHREILLFSKAEGGEAVDLSVQATGMHPHVSISGAPQAPRERPFTYGGSSLAVYDPELFGLYFDMVAAYGVMLECGGPRPSDNVFGGMYGPPPATPRAGQLLYALNEVVNRFDGSPEGIAECRVLLAAVYQKPADASAHRISAIGHSHIDTAWLWPLERTQYKCIHTFATALRYMDLYPEYKFICSQAAQYEWVKHTCPALYARIKEKVKAGQWEVTGSMWVEADCNVISGESLIRHILHGKNFFQDEFGIETRDLWLPDVFGYSAALPQILKRAGIDYFLTQKISWNQINKFPHHTFLWRGVDGTEIFSHFPPADTYVGNLSPAELSYSVRNFRENDRASRSLYAFGYGDGGGGPTVEMLESARRLADVEGMPRVEIEKALDFFQKAEAEARDLPIWVGELYLELHRGTYTTQARNKRANRKSELALRDAEFLNVAAPAGLGGYPSEALDRAWKSTLLNQFHDIIPGSSIQEVYRDSAIDYAAIAETAESAIESAAAEIGDAVNTRGLKRPVLVWSNLSHFANEVVEVGLRSGERPVAAVGPDGDIVPVQILEGDRACFLAKNSPLHGYAVWDLAATTVPVEVDDAVSVSLTHLENELLRVELDLMTGLITRVYDKLSEREVLGKTRGPEGLLVDACANQFQLFEDRPLFWDAWDVDIFAYETGRVVTELDSLTVIEEGPVRGAIRLVRRFGSSTITQTIQLTAYSPRIDFITEVDWHETDRMLKVGFPVAINAPRATYEIQYGSVERPTHHNTSWDTARFEVCAQRWADLSEGDYGVALLNDCKYGHDTRDNVMRLTLLRSPCAPDPEADRGRQEFTYSLLPHAEDFRDGEVIEQAAALNSPPRARALVGNRPGPLPLEQSYFSVDNAAVYIEAIKKAEREEAIIVRVYEGHNSRGQVTLTTTLPVKQAWLCSLLEKELEEIPVSGGEVILAVKPFEIVTVKFTL